MLDLSLIAAEEKHLVLDNRSADRATKLVASKAVAGRRKVVACVEVVVADELGRAAMKLVGAGIRDQVHRRRGAMPVARRQRARFHLELLQRIGPWRRQ